MNARKIFSGIDNQILCLCKLLQNLKLIKSYFIVARIFKSLGLYLNNIILPFLCNKTLERGKTEQISKYLITQNF